MLAQKFGGDRSHCLPPEIYTSCIDIALDFHFATTHRSLTHHRDKNTNEYAYCHTRVPVILLSNVAPGTKATNDTIQARTATARPRTWYACISLLSWFRTRAQNGASVQ